MVLVMFSIFVLWKWSSPDLIFLFVFDKSLMLGWYCKIIYLYVSLCGELLHFHNQWLKYSNCLFYNVKRGAKCPVSCIMRTRKLELDIWYVFLNSSIIKLGNTLRIRCIKGLTFKHPPLQNKKKKKKNKQTKENKRKRKCTVAIQSYSVQNILK